MNLGEVLDIVGAVFIAIGALLNLIAAIGLVRLPDALGRMHAASKPQSLGMVVLCLGLGLILRSPAAAGMLTLAVGLQLMTTPVATHMMGRSAYRTGQFKRDVLELDEGAGRTIGILKSDRNEPEED